MNGFERLANESAEFLPAGNIGTDQEKLPAVKVAGCLVFAYVEDGQLRVSVDLDDAGEFWQSDQSDCVPMTIRVQGDTVFAADSAGTVTAGSAVRYANHTTKG